MKDCLGVALPILILFALALYSGLPHPTHDQVSLKAAAAASNQLLAASPAGPKSEAIHLPRDLWPSAIATLRPTSVTVRQGMVDITIKPFFDGGWGYGFAPDKRNLTMLAECWTTLGQGMYWHGPC